MNSEGEELWNKYCTFLYEDFQKQVEYNHRKMDEYFKKLSNTKLPEALGAKNIENIKQMPITTYDDYSFLKTFEERIRRLETSVLRGRNETLAEYYMRIGRMAAEPIKEYLPGEFQSCVKTSGTTAQSKWVIWTKLFREAYREVGLAPMIMACSRRIGDTQLRLGDTVLNMGAPSPYLSGWSIHFLLELFQLKIYPSFEVIDKTYDIRRRIWMVLKKIDEMKEEIAFIGTTASLLFLIIRYITDRQSFYEEYWKSSRPGITKAYMFSKLISTKLFWKPRSIKKVLPVKGLICAGFDSKIYSELFKRNFETEPLNLYGASEIGFPMYGTVDDRYNMVLDLRTGYFEFVDVGNGDVFEVNELKKGRSYGLITTPFGGSMIRYKIGDIFKVEDLRDDGMPIFSFEGRDGYSFDIYGYFRIDESLATKIMIKAGLTSSENWCFAKLIEPSERICILMEKERNFNEASAVKIIFKELLEESEDFRNFVRDFGIKNPTDIIKVEYLRRGAFIRYSNLRLKMGSPYGQIKPLKVIPTQKMEVFETLRGM